MKTKLFKILPSFIKRQKHADKIAHAVYGTTFYLLLCFFLQNELSLMLTFLLAVLVEIYDKYNGGKSNFYDFLATVFIPTILLFL